MMRYHKREKSTILYVFRLLGDSLDEAYPVLLSVDPQDECIDGGLLQP